MLFTKDLPRGQLTYTLVGMPVLVVLLTVGMIVLPDTFPFVIMVLMITMFIPLSIAHFRRVKANTVAPTHRRIEILSPMAPDALFAKLEGAKFEVSKLGKLRLKDRDAERRVLVLEAPQTGMCYGFHIPVFVRDAGIGTTVEVGIMPKMLQHVETVEKWHRSVAAEIERAVTA